MGDRRSRDRRDRYGYQPRGASPHRTRKKSPSPKRYNYREHSPGRARTNSPARARVPSPSRQDVNTRNLHVWGQWRTEVNENLISDFFYSTKRRDRKSVQPLETLIKDQGVYIQDSKIDQTRGLLNYSLSTNRVTDLEPNDFLRYGIPRAKLNPSNREYKKLLPAEEPSNGTTERKYRSYNTNSSAQYRHTNTNGATDTRDMHRYADEPRRFERQHNGQSYGHSNIYSNVQSENVRSLDTSKPGYVEASLPRASGYQGSQLDGSNRPKDVAFTPRTDYSKGDTARGEPTQNALYSSISPASNIPAAPPPPPPPPPLPSSVALPYKPKMKQGQST